MSELKGTIGSNGLSTLYRPLQEHAVSIDARLRDFHVLCVQCPSSAYVSGHCFLSVKQNACRDGSGKTVFLIKKLRKCQRVVSLVSIYGSKHPRMDNNMVEAVREEMGV